MLGLVIVFLLSWIILWFLAKKHVTILGISPNSTRLKEFFIGFVFMAFMCAINLWGQSYFKDFSYVLNPDYGVMDSIDATWWTFKAALLEELAFRGAILYLLIRKIGPVKACFISASAFGVYHWFSYELIGGRIIPMVYVFLLTGAAGWIFAYAFAKTKSLFAPLGLHFGWIIISIVIFSEGPLGSQLFARSNEASEMELWPTLLFFLWQAVVTPGIVIYYLRKKYSSLP
jgi:uncharacterized protein